MVTADYYYPDWVCLVDFLQSGIEKLLVWAAEDWTDNLRSLFSVRCLWPLSHGNPVMMRMKGTNFSIKYEKKTLWLGVYSASWGLKGSNSSNPGTTRQPFTLDCLKQQIFPALLCLLWFNLQDTHKKIFKK